MFQRQSSKMRMLLVSLVTQTFVHWLYVATLSFDIGINASIAFPHGQILVQDDVGGLEVEDPNRPGSFIVRWPALTLILTTDTITL